MSEPAEHGALTDNLASIQYLRGIAAVAVVYFHTSVYLSQVAWPLPRGFGIAGVDLFFVISGFIMLAITAQNRDTIASFVRKRLIRIVPLYWAANLAAFLLFLAIPSAFIKESADVGHVLLSMLFIPHDGPGGDGAPFFKIGWTLNFEMYFYAVFALALLIRQVEMRLLAIGTFFAAMIGYGIAFGAHNAALGYYTNPIVLEFLMGSLIGYLVLRGGVRRVPWPVALAVLAVAAGVILVDLRQGSGNVARVLWLGVPSALIALALLALEIAGRLRRSSLLALLGDASYSIYLAHPFILTGMRALLQKSGLATEQPLIGAVVIIASCLLAIAAGILVFRFIETPMLKILRGQMFRRRAELPAG